MKLVIALLVTIMTLAVFCNTSYATDRHAYGSLGIETPIGSTPDRPQDNTPSVLGELHLTNLLGHVGVFTSGQIQTSKGLPFERENKFRVGLEAPVGGGITAYTYFERRFDLPTANRFMVGARWGFNVPF